MAGGRAAAGLDPASVAASAQVFVEDLDRPLLSADDAHHLGRVLRLATGEPVVAADGTGNWRLCRYHHSADPAPGGRTGAGGGRGGSGRLEVEGPVRRLPAPPTTVTVGFVPVKGDRPEWVVQKLTELGVDRIVVLRSSRSVVRWEGARSDRALDRLRRVVREAAAQSRRARLPVLQGVWALDQFASSVAPPGALALADRRGEPPCPGLRCLAVGPEGGWDEPERGEFPLVSLGVGVLRAETAAVAGGTLLCALRDGLLRGP